MSQPLEVAKDLIKSLTNDHILLLSQIDRRFIEDLLFKQERGKYDTEAGPEVSALISKILVRIRKEKEQYVGRAPKTVHFISEVDVKSQVEQSSANKEILIASPEA